MAKASSAVADLVPHQVREGMGKASGAAAGTVLLPAQRAALSLLNLVNDWAAELNDPAAVIRIAKKNGLDITDIKELKSQDLKTVDRLLTRNTLRWRTLGTLEGGGMGAVALIPVAGLPASLTLDLIIIQVLSISIAARVAYSYGFDAKDPAEQEFIRRLVERTFTVQAAKSVPMKETAHAAAAVQGRVRWSEKLLKEEKLMRAVRDLLEKLGTRSGSVSVGAVGKALPFVGIVVGAGTNAAVLGNVAKDAQRFCQTRFLSEKYGLPMPAPLARFDQFGGPALLTEDED